MRESSPSPLSLMMRRRYFLRGVYIACGAFVCIAIVLFVRIGLSYDGSCGGFLPALAGPRPCSFWEYVFGSLLLFAVLLGATYWPLVLALLIVPPFIGFLLDRRAEGPAS
jgi:hypothetical protein